MYIQIYLYSMVWRASISTLHTIHKYTPLIFYNYQFSHDTTSHPSLIAKKYIRHSRIPDISTIKIIAYIYFYNIAQYFMFNLELHVKPCHPTVSYQALFINVFT